MIRRSSPIRFPLGLALTGALLVSLMALGCGPTLYELPSTQVVEQAVEARANAERPPVVDESLAQARAALLRLHHLLSTQRFSESLEFLSQETQDFLALGSTSGSADQALARGELRMPDGKVRTFEPVAFLLAEDISELADSLEGEDVHETDRRKVLFAVQPSGEVRQIVMIKEGNQWVLHRTTTP